MIISDEIIHGVSHESALRRWPTAATAAPVRHQGHARGEAEVFLSPPRGGTGFSNQWTRRHLIVERRFLARRAQETEQRRALFNAETDAEGT